MKKTTAGLFIFFAALQILFSYSNQSEEEIKPSIYKQTSLEYITNPSHEYPDEKSVLKYNAPFLLGTERQEVEDFRTLFKTEKYKSLLRDSLENSLELRLYVRKAIEQAGLPPELEYLPVVESYYKTTAKSKSGALGLWQFMANSVKPYLELNDYVDERLDPWKETTAALRKLEDNYKTFGDWLIAIAAYNCGAGAMQKAITKGGKKDFWYLCENKLLPVQTMQYVPKLLAIADLCMHTDFYQMDISLRTEEYYTLYNETYGIFDYVTVTKPYSLKTLARELRIDYSILAQLNPSFTQGFTHPNKESSIRLPFGMKQSALDALEKMTPLDFPVKYTVKSGDTLWGISRQYGVTVSAICELNNIKENAILSIGKILYIPSKLSR